MRPSQTSRNNNMIKVIDDWYITVEENPINYVVRRGNGEKDKKQGWKDKPRGYFGSLRKAVEEVREQIIAEKFSMGSSTLAEAIRTIKDVDARFEKIMESVTA